LFIPESLARFAVVREPQRLRDRECFARACGRVEFAEFVGLNVTVMMMIVGLLKIVITRL
jgi:hypothetical protein